MFCATNASLLHKVIRFAYCMILISEVILINKGLSIWMTITVLQVSLQGYLKLII